MKYINPLSFLQPDGGDTALLVDKKKLSLEKKKLLAEIELSDRKTVMVNGIEMSKNDVLNMFDQLQNSDELDYHAAIADDAALTHFLDTGTIDAKKTFNNNPVYTHPSFLRFISPFFEIVFTPAALDALKNSNAAVLRALFSNPVLLTVEDQEKSYARLTRYLHEQREQLQKFKERALLTRTVVPDIFQPFVNSGFIASLNALPYEFLPYRNEYAVELINLGVGFHALDVGFATKILANNRDMDCDEDLKRQNQDRYEKLSDMAMNTVVTAPGQQSQFNWKIIFFVIIGILRLCFALQRCSSSSSSYNNYDNRPPVTYEYEPREISPTQLLDLRFQDVVAFTNALTTDVKNVANNKGTINRSTRLKTGSNPYRDILRYINGSGRSVSSDSYEEKLSFINRCDHDVIAIIRSEDSVWACFVNRNDKVQIRLREGLNTICFYVGDNWNPKRQIATKFHSINGGVDMPVAGAFDLVTGATRKHLKDQYMLTVDNPGGSGSPGKSSFTIEDLNGFTDITYNKGSADNVKSEVHSY